MNRQSRNQRVGRQSGRRIDVFALDGSTGATADGNQSDRRTTTGIKGRGHRHTLDKVGRCHGHVPSGSEGRDNSDDWEMEEQIIHEVPEDTSP